MRRCPFSENIDRSVDVTLVGRCAIRTRPCAVSQCDLLIDMPTGRAHLRGWEPLVDMVHYGACFCSHLVQHVNKCSKTKIGDLASPQGSHALQFESLKSDEVIVSTKFMCQFPVKCVSLICNALMDTGKALSSFLAIVRTLLLLGKLAVGLYESLQTMFQRLRGVIFSSITTREVGRQPKVKACAFTRHDSFYGRELNDTGEIYVQVSKEIAFDRDRFDNPVNLSRLGEFVDSRANAQSVVPKQFPTSLRQGERFSFCNLSKRRWANPLCSFARFAGIQVPIETLIALIYAAGYLLNSLRTKLLTPRILWQAFQFGQVGLQCVQRQMLLAPTVVPFMERNAMVMNRPANINLAMQTLAVSTPIQFVREHLATRHFIPSRFAWSRIITSSLAVMLMPDLSASRRKSLLASIVRRRLVACGFSMPQLYHYIAVSCNAVDTLWQSFSTPVLRYGVLQRL